jgi:hypothetical protein
LFVPRIFQDDLPALSVSRLRALGVITTETTMFRVQLGDVELDVSVHLRRFPSGGSWSWFGCPACGRWVRVLKLFDGAVLCWRCCQQRGVRRRAWPLGIRQRAELRIPKLKAMLESEQSLRLKPHLWGKMEKRTRFEAALARAEFILSKGPRYRDVLKQTP